MFLSLNQNSIRMVDRVYLGFKIKYPQWKVEKYNSGDIHCNGIFLDVYRPSGELANKYFFCPGVNGEIASIAIYGVALQNHYNTISSSRVCFGLPVTDICIDREGLSDFVDIQIGSY